MALWFLFPINPLFALLINYHLSIYFEAIQSYIFGKWGQRQKYNSKLSTCIITAKGRATYSLMNSFQCFPKLMSTTRSYFSTRFAVGKPLVAKRVISNMVTGGDSVKWGWRSEIRWKWQHLIVVKAEQKLCEGLTWTWRTDHGIDEKNWGIRLGAVKRNGV